MIFGIVIDSWKLPVFKKMLETEKRSFTEHARVDGTVCLQVEADDMYSLRRLVQRANYTASQ